MTEEAQPVPIEADAATLAELRGKLDALGSDQTAAYALSLGLYPPNYRAGAPESVVEYWAPGDDDEEIGTLVWGSTFPVDEGDDEDDDQDGPDPWATAAPPAAREQDEDGPDPWASA